MNKLIIKETKYTPLINFDINSRVLEIKGKSYPENTFEFYKPILNWTKKYFNYHSKDKTIINFEIIYFNSSSSKLFFDFFDIIEEAQKKEYNIEINWIYDEENEVALEAGEDFKEDFSNLNFNLMKK